jgi:hypothetical protein
MFKSLFATVLLIVCALLPSQANEVSFSASAPQQVAVGEPFRITFSLDARPADFQPPAFSGFRVLSGPSQSSSSSTQIINNQVTTTVSFSYTYVLEATEEGTFAIEPARVTVDGSNYRSNRINIRVSGQADPGGQPSPARPATPPQPPQTEVTARDVFLRAVPSTTSPYQSEQVIVSYRLYYRVPVTNYSIDRLPSYQGFWSETLSGFDPGAFTTEVIDGVSYRVSEIRRVALFPQRSGEITIEPLEVDCSIRMPSQRRRGSLIDEFFGGSIFDSFQNVQQTVRSNAVRLQVKPLPTQNRPAAFKGMVGNLEISATLEPRDIQVNDAANLVITVRGSGNLRMLEKPQVNFPLNLEVFDPNITDNITSGSSGISGSRVYDFILIPRTGGTFEIPSIPLAYFDPAAGRYVTKSTQAFTLEVSGAGVDGTAGLPSREQVRTLASDIRFIVVRQFALQPAGSIFFRSNLFYFMLFAPLFLFGGFMIYWRQQIRLQSDKALLRNRKADKLARKRLKQAHTCLKNNERNAFYDEISRSLWGYIGDKLNIPGARLNREEVSKQFQEKGVPEHLRIKFLEAIDDCEFARFAPGNQQTLMDETYQKTMETIISLEKELRNKR